MADYIAERIFKPPFFQLSHLKSGRNAKREPYVIGFDSEAESGRPFMFQFAHPDNRCDILKIPLRTHAGLGEFFKYVRNECVRADREYIIVGWNLAYEWTQLFADLPQDFVTQDTLTVGVTLNDNKAVLIRALNQKRYTLTAEFGIKHTNNECRTRSECKKRGYHFTPTTHRRAKLIDGYAFLPMSLNSAGEMLGLGRKETKPREFSRRAAFDENGDVRKDFRAYAEQDARLTQRIGEYIVGLHKSYDVSLCVSAPHFASKVFRRAFIHSEIPLPDQDVEQFGLWSYHGGKNGFYLDKPSRLAKIWHYDIRSAYPEAMAQLPNVEHGEWSFSENYVPHSHSIWKIEARHTSCKYRAFMDEFGKWIGNGVITSVVTGYELDAAIELGEIELISASGYVFEGPETGALREYVATFYAQKRDAKTPGERAEAKLHLNSLYGKFFQKVPRGSVGSIDLDTGEYIYHDYDEEFDFDAGGLYHPPIASLITGYVRAKIHRLEHQYEAVMTSTDGFFAYKPPIGNELGDELGELEAHIGTLRIWRERLYIFYPENCGAPRCRRKHAAYAMHGFRGKRSMLARVPLIWPLNWEYVAQQMVTLRQAGLTHDGKSYKAGEFAVLPYVLRLVPP